MMVVQWLAVLAREFDVLASIPATSKPSSKELTIGNYASHL